MDWWTLGLQAVNFLVLIGLLQHFLYGPVLAAIDRRRDHMGKLTAAVQEAQAKAVQAETAWHTRQREDENQRQELRRQVLAEAKRSEDEILAQARHEATRIFEQSRLALAAERDSVAAQLRDEATEVAVDLATSLLVQVAATVGVTPFLELAERHFAALSPAERQNLLPGAATHRVMVELFPPLPAAALAEWQRRLAAALGQAELAMREQPQLIAGIRLIFPTASWEISWAGALAAAEQEIRSHAKPA